MFDLTIVAGNQKIDEISLKIIEITFNSFISYFMNKGYIIKLFYFFDFYVSI